MKKKLIALLTLCCLFCFGGCAAEKASVVYDTNLTVHFIDVGQADCSLITCDGHAMLIDGGNKDDSSLVYSYLKKQGVDSLDYMICTHAHEDHCGGLSGALQAVTVKQAFAPVTTSQNTAFKNFVKYLKKQNLKITVPSPGDTLTLGKANITILGPQKQYENVNDTSIVLRINYGKTSFLFVGDAGIGPEKDMIEAGCNLRSTVLKVGHHGSTTASSYVFLRDVLPSYAVISVGKDNSYDLPTDDVLSRLRDVGAQVYRTDLQGTIICTSDGKTVSFQTEKSADAKTVNPTILEEQTSAKKNGN